MNKINYIKISLGLAIGSIIAFTSSFIRTQIKLIKISSFDYKGAVVTQMSVRKVTIRLDWTINNRSSLTAYISNQEYDVYINDNFVKKIGYSSTIKINPNSTTIIPTYISIVPEDFRNIKLIDYAKMLTKEGREKIELKVIGSFDVKSEFITLKKFPFEFKDTVQNIYN